MFEQLLLVDIVVADISIPNANVFYDSNYMLGGGLEPHFRVLFSAVFQVFPCGISIRLEICGK